MQNIGQTYIIRMIMPFSLFLFLGISISTAQKTTPNPFDLTFRLDKEEQLAIEKPDFNPFDISSPTSSLLTERKEALKKSGKAFWQLRRFEGDLQVSRNIFLGITISLLLFTTIVVSLFRDKLSTTFQSVRNINLMNIAYRDMAGRFHPHILFFDFISIISFALYGTFLFIDTHLNSSNILQALITAFLLSSFYYFSKWSILSVLKHIFPNKKEFGKYILMFHQMNHVLGLLLIPFIIFFAFSDENITYIATIISFIVIGFWYMARLFRGLQIGGKFLSINIFRFFAYLCSVEIAPLVVLLTTIKLILSLGI